MNIFLVAVVNGEPARKRTWGWYEKFKAAGLEIATTEWRAVTP